MPLIFTTSTGQRVRFVCRSSNSNSSSFKTKFQCKFMTERKSKPKVIILRSYFPRTSVATYTCDGFEHLAVESSCWRIGGKFFLLKASCGYVYLLDRLVKGPSKLWDGRILEREEGSNNQITSSWQASRNGRFPCGNRLLVVCNVGHQITRFSQFETSVSSEKRTGGHNVEAGTGGGMDTEGSANLKRTVLSKKRTCWAHRGTMDGGSC